MKDDIEHLTGIIEIQKLFASGAGSFTKIGRKYLKSTRIERVFAKKTERRVDASLMYAFSDLILFVSGKAGLLSSKGSFRVEGTLAISSRFLASEIEGEERGLLLRQNSDDAGYVVTVSNAEERKEWMDCFRVLFLSLEDLRSPSHAPVLFHYGWLGKKGEKGLKTIKRRWVEVTGELLCYYSDDSVSFS